jgi:undecaprenyl-diphosphatase
MIWDVIKSIIYGIVEGITEWLPISSTGHIILTQNFISFNDVSSGFPEMFNYVIQLGAIFAVILLFFKKLWPFKMPDKGAKVLSVNTGIFKEQQWVLWFKVLIATLPSVLALPIDSKIEEIMYDEATGKPTNLGVGVISAMLIFYGILFIIIERYNKKRNPIIQDVSMLSYKTALLIGLFQVLAIIPGTSRSGATIIGALILGVSRSAAAEFSFFMAVPTMVGISALKILQFLSENPFTTDEFIILLVGMIVSFVVSVIAIRALMAYVKKKDFSFFGYYRIVLGLIVLAFVIFN